MSEGNSVGAAADAARAGRGGGAGAAGRRAAPGPRLAARTWRRSRRARRSWWQELGAFRPDQFGNLANARAHEQGTGREIWEQTGGRVDVWVASVGTGGTFVGVARALKARNPRVRCLAAEPATAPALAGGPITDTCHRLEGTGYARVPPLWDPALCDGFLTVTDADAIDTARRLATREGIFCGCSSGANVAAALQVAATAPARAPSSSPWSPIPGSRTSARTSSEHTLPSPSSDRQSSSGRQEK